MKLHLTYGQLADAIPSLKDFLWVSEQSFIRTAEIIGADPKDWQSPEARALKLLMVHALNTSQSIRLLVTHGQPLEALALLRVRLEQLIVCSYLLNAPNEVGFKPFLADLGRINHRAIDNLTKDADLKRVIQSVTGIDESKARSEAINVEQYLDPNFDPASDRISRKWTDLSTFDLALHRDKYASQTDPITSLRFVWYYLGIYQNASIFIHSETGILTPNYLASDRNREPAPQPAYVLLDLTLLAQYDIVQCYEIVGRFKKPQHRVGELMTELRKALDRPL